MRTRTVAALTVALLIPASLFMLALLVRNFTPLPFKVTDAAQQIVAWYSARMWTLWVFLLALPTTVMASGAATLRYKNEDLPRIWRGLLAVVTLAAGGILAIVVLHMMAN
jgi:hypothetical protein